MILFVVLFLLGFGIIRIDHIFLDLGVYGIHTEKCAVGEQNHENTDDHKRHKDRSKPNRERHKDHATAEHHEIASETENGENRCVFDDLKERCDGMVRNLTVPSILLIFQTFPHCSGVTLKL